MLPNTGVAGVGFTTIFTVAVADVHPKAAAYTLYVPLAAVVTFVRVGFCAVDVKPFGPVQLLPLAAVEVRFSVAPEHSGLLPPATGLAGVGFTVTFTVAVAEVQPEATV